MGKRQEAAQETRQKILAALHALLEEKSLNDISIEEITTRAGVAKGSFYTYFKRKEDAACYDALEKYSSVTQEALRASGNVYQNLCAYLNGSAEIIERYSLQSAQGWMKSVTAPLEGEARGVRKYLFDSENISRLIRLAAQRGELSLDVPVKELTELIMNAYYGAVAVWCLTSGLLSLKSGVAHFCEYGLQAILNQYRRGETDHRRRSVE